MLRISTLVFNVKSLMKCDLPVSNISLLQQGLNDSYEPSAQSIQNILAFSDAYYHQKTKGIGDIDLVLN